MIGDSGAVVTPFMQDGTYPPRNFATFGPSGLQPPFTGTYILSFTENFHLAALGRRQTQYIILNLAESCVFSKQSLPPLLCHSVRSLPFPEVTVLICRVPSIIFFHRLSIFNPLTCVSFNTVLSD